MRFAKQVLLSGLACLSACFAHSQEVWTSRHVCLDKKGSLTYYPDSLGNTLPDFSRVGYYQGDRPLPDVKIVKTISAGEENSQQIIQAAIDEVAAMPLQKNGFRGAIVLKNGVYKIPGTIKITRSGIVLKGEGDATRLIATGSSQR